MAAIIVMVALVLPAQYLVSQQSPSAPTANSIAQTTAQTSTVSTEQGRVAGASTRSSSIITIPIINVTIDLNDQSQLLYLVGGGLIIFSVILFVIATEPKKQEQKLPPHWR